MWSVLKSYLLLIFNKSILVFLYVLIGAIVENEDSFGKYLL